MAICGFMMLYSFSWETLISSLDLVLCSRSLGRRCHRPRPHATTDSCVAAQMLGSFRIWPSLKVTKIQRFLAQINVPLCSGDFRRVLILTYPKERIVVGRPLIAIPSDQENVDIAIGNIHITSMSWGPPNCSGWRSTVALDDEIQVPWEGNAPVV